MDYLKPSAMRRATFLNSRRTFKSHFPHFLGIVLMCHALLAFGQSPGGVDGPIAWIINTEVSAVGSSIIPEQFAANYALLPPEGIQETLESVQIVPGQYSMFVVLHPSETSREEIPLLGFGSLKLSNFGIVVNGQNKENSYKTNEPRLLTVQWKEISSAYNPQRFYGKYNPDCPVQIAELIIYNKRLTPKETRQVESYLAMKYSININHIATSEDKSYWSSKKQVLWHQEKDGQFNESIVVIGRDNGSGLYQCQSATIGEHPIKFSLNEERIFGEHLLSDIADQSYIVFSKKPETAGGMSNCVMELEVEQLWGGWKFQLRNFEVSSNSVLIRVPLDYLSAETTMPYALVDNGYEMNLYEVVIDSLSLLIEIPLEGRQNDIDYFISLVEMSRKCKPEIEVTASGVANCSNPLLGQINIRLSDVSTPLFISLNHALLGYCYSSELSNREIEISTLPAGQYTYSITDESSNLVMSGYFSIPFELNNGVQSIGIADYSRCLMEFIQDELVDLAWFEVKANIEISEGEAQKNIIVFPNPVKSGRTLHLQYSGFGNEMVEHHIYSESGALIRSFQIGVDGSAIHEEQLDAPGVYIIRSTTADSSFVHKVVVQ